MGRSETPPALHAQDRGVLRFVTLGSVDDGKSTLIGRLLYDSRSLQEDQLVALERASQRRGAGEVDLSLLTDGLEAEREQGITIDVAYRYFATPRRKFIIGDSPGHEQYTRNMATGASTADVLVLLLDVAKGLLPQSRRHLLIARLFGIRRAAVFVNKMDGVGYSRDAFDRARREVEEFATLLAFDELQVLPGSALRGDMVVDRGSAMGWYSGPTLLEWLESVEAGHEQAAVGSLRFPVQLVSRPVNGTARGYMGRVESGVVLAGAEVQVLPGGRKTRVREILTLDGPREVAVAGDSVTLVLADDIDIARGDLIASALGPREAKSLAAKLVWLDPDPLRLGGRYVVQHGTRRMLARVSAVHSQLELQTLTEQPAGDEVRANDIVRATLSLQSPLYVDSYSRNRATGSFILVDEATNRTVAAGLVE